MQNNNNRLDEYVASRASSANFDAEWDCVHAWLYAISDDHDIVMLGETCEGYIADHSGIDMEHVGFYIERLADCEGYDHVRDNLVKVHQPRLRGHTS